MGALDTVKESLSGPGKKWVIGGAILAGGYLWWTRVRSTGASTKPGDATITDGGAAVADPVTPAGGDYSPASGTAERPQNNGEWLSQAVAILILPPYNRPSAATYNALSKALGGQPLTTAEGAIVELAIQVKGTPPEGMPQLNIASPSSPTTTDPTPTPDGDDGAPATPGGIRATGQRKNWISLGCDAVSGADGYRFYNEHLFKYTDVSGPAMDWWVTNSTATHRFAVAARKGGKVSAPTAFISVQYSAK